LARQFTLGKQERLKSRKAIDVLFLSGNRFSAGCFRVFFLLQPVPGLVSGFGVSSRNFKKAVDRNRVKRLAREVYRLQKLPLEVQLDTTGKGLHIFFIYTAKELPLYADLYETMTVILNRLVKYLNENTAATT
jgi:ribonuclease P protein component